MAEVTGWTHEYMMKMDKRLFMRYYGYWYAEQLITQIRQEEAEKKNNQPRDNPKTWKQL